MIRGTCPICSKAYQITTLDQLPSFPFCSDRCRLVDLGRWVDGRYAIPVAPAASSADDDDEQSPPAEDG
jgi:endogenous inhibitor of DNA gyrase (YacG/DUF329 family)